MSRYVLLVVLVFANACSKPNALACCTSTEDCNSVGIDYVKGCDTGQFCENHTCVSASCTTDTDCPAVDPVCDGICVQCNATHACSPRFPVCDLQEKSCGVCTTDSDCGAFAGTPHCDSSSGGCVQCGTGSDCSGTTPVCDAQSCRACGSDSECDTHACNDDGSCVPEANVVWISPSGLDSGSCTRANPCANLTYAVLQSSSTRPHIVFTAPETNVGLKVAISSGSTTAPMLYIHANGSTFTEPTNGQGTMLDLGISTLVRDATFYSQTGTMVPIDARGAMTRLEHVTFNHTNKILIDGTTVATDLRLDHVYPQGGYDIVVGAGVDFTLTRAVVIGSPVITTQAGAHVHITNLMAYGISLMPLDLQLATGELQFSTITGGFVNSTDPCVMTCTGTMHIISSIIWAPACMDTTGSNDAVPAGCSYQSSIVSNSTPPTGTINTDPMFVNFATNDLHIQPTSPAVDAVDTGPATDFEGDKRPGGVKFDIGADEIP